MSNKHFIVIAGPNGAGKSTSSKRIVEEYGIEAFDWDKHFCRYLKVDQRGSWEDAEINVLKCKIIDVIMAKQTGVNVLIYGRIPGKHLPQRYEKARELAIEYCANRLECRTEDIKFSLRLTCVPHFSKVFKGASDDDIIEMQDGIVVWQGGLLEGSSSNFILENHSWSEIQRQRKQSTNDLVYFISNLSQSDPERKLITMTRDEHPHMFNYIAKWKDTIFQYITESGKNASLQSPADLTVMNMHSYLGMRGYIKGIAKMKRKKHSAEARAKISKAKKGKKHSAEARAKMSKAKKGKKRSVEHCANISEAKKGKNNTIKTRAQ